MQRIAKQVSVSLPYALHDAKVVSMEMQGDTLFLQFAEGYGYRETMPPFRQVAGSLQITEVDAESSYVYLMRYAGGHTCGRFSGESLSLCDFLAIEKKLCFEVIQETYSGSSCCVLKGLCHEETETLCEMAVELYYHGNWIYAIEE